MIDTKPSFLEMGVAVAIPVDDEGREDWDTFPRQEVIIPADPAKGRPLPVRMEDATDHPLVVALARCFSQLVQTGEARPGPLGAPA